MKKKIIDNERIHVVVTQAGYTIWPKSIQRLKRMKWLEGHEHGRRHIWLIENNEQNN